MNPYLGRWAYFLPLSGATMAGHCSLVRTRSHYLTDVLAGGALAVAVALGLRAWWPPAPSGGTEADRSARAEERLMTTVDGERARLAVHIEPAAVPPPAPGLRATRAGRRPH